MSSGKTDPFSPELIGELSMTDIIRLQELLSRELRRRFEKQRALAFSDVVGSTDYFARFGDEAGRRLQQRHSDLLGPVVQAAGGSIVGTGGDGAFLVFASVEAAAGAAIALQKAIANDNLGLSREQQLCVRIGLHWGTVLSDDSHVTGDAVNLAARVTGSAAPGEIRLTREACEELPSELRPSTRPLGAVELQGFPRAIAVFALDWRPRDGFPDLVRIRETSAELDLPDQDTIRFGRLKESDGLPANDIVLLLPDEIAARKISRWHFELRRHPDAYLLRPVSEQTTELDGVVVPKGSEVPIRPGSVVRIGRVMTLEFLARSAPSAPASDESTLVTPD